MTNKPIYGIWKFLIFNNTHFPDPTFQNGFGEAISQEFSVLRSSFPYENVYLSQNDLLFIFIPMLVVSE